MRGRVFTYDVKKAVLLCSVQKQMLFVMDFICGLHYNNVVNDGGGWKNENSAVHILRSLCAVFVAAFCACEKDGAVLGGESVDYGTLEVADVYLYNNYPEAEILFEFSDPQYAEKPVLRSTAICLSSKDRA